MDHYHWPKHRTQPSRSAPQPPQPTQSPQPNQPQQQQPPATSSSASAFLPQPLMPTAGFPSYPHPNHPPPPPPPPPPFHSLQHSQAVRDPIVAHPHTFQNVQNPLGVPIQQHSLPQLSSLHHHSISSQPPPQQHSTQVNAPPHSQMLMPPHQMQHPTHPAHMQQQQPQQMQPPPQHPQQPQPQQPPQPPPSQHLHRPHHQLPPPHQPSHHPSQQQPQSGLTIQPPTRRMSPPALQSPQNRPLHSPQHPSDPSNPQHLPPPDSVNSQIAMTAPRLPHLQPPNAPPQQLSQRPIQPPPQQQQYHQQHPSAHHRSQSRDVKRVMYDNPPPYRLAQPQQQYYNPYSTQQPPSQQSQQIPQHSQMYSSMPPQSHEYQRRQSSMPLPHESATQPLPSQHRLPPPMHAQPAQQQQQPPPVPQQRPSQKLVAPLQPQPLSMSQMPRTQEGQQPPPPHQSQHHHLQQQPPPESAQKQSLSSAPTNQPHQLPHHHPQALQPPQPLPSPAAQRLQLPERRPTPNPLHQPPQSQIHMTSASIPTTLQLADHHNQMQRQVMTAQGMPPRDRTHTVQPLMAQQPKPSQSHPMPQQPSQSQSHAKMPPGQHQPQHQQQPVPQRKSHLSQLGQHAIQDAISKPTHQRGSMRDDARLASSGSVNRSQVKQEDVGEQAGGFRQLKVEDALAYLEQVKSQFSGRPNVYNHFLDIMKEFKAQTIDTAEVIRRVSSLFQGHRKLILGFNTFLPPGFKIELRDDPTRGCVTGFSTPGGVFIALNGEEVISSQAPAMSLQGDVMPAQSQTPMSVDGTHHAQAPHNGQTQHHQMPQAQPREMHRAAQIPRPAESVYDRAAYMKPLIEAEEKVSMGLASSHGQHLSMSHGGADVRMKAAGVAQASNDTAAAALAGGFGSPATAAAVSGKPIEFDQAVTYVNKIKSRFSHNEAVYRTFLGILQTYQKEQKSIKEVHKQVSHLFKDHDDLLGEFSHFLPEQSPQTQRLGAAGQRIVSEGLSSRGKGQSVHVKQQPVLEGAISEQPSELQGSLWKGKEKSGKGSSTAKGKSTKSIPGAVGGITKQGSTPRQKSSAQDKKNRRTVSSTKKIGGETKLGHSPATAVGGGTAAEGPTPELEFFDELRNLLGSEGQQNYSEFIKCLSLFSQEIICGDELMRLADGLLNNRKPLTEAFRAFLNQADPKATQTAVSILRKAKTTAEGNGPPGSKGHSAPPIANTSAVRERVRDLPPLVGIGAPGPAHSGSRSPKINPLYKGKPLSEIGREFGTGLAETNSYVTLPSDLGPIQCTGMSAGDRSVLNHLCVSKGKTSGKSLLGDDRSRSLPDIKRSQSIAPRVAPTGKGHSHSGVSVSETPGSPRAVRDSSSETKLSIEDQRVELDLMISRALNTALKLERLIKGEIRNVSSLTAVDLKPLEMIYKDASCDIVDVLRSNPSVTAPVVLKSLMERLEDWKASRTTLEKIWKSKLFSSRSGTADSPRTWRRSELLDELFSEAKSANRSVEQSAEEETTDRKDVAAQLKTVNGELMCKDQNLSIVCDILWYAFEWEARDEDEADQGLEFLERVYRVLRKAQLESVAIFVDENLYVYIRLLCETSKRVQYVLDHNYDGLTADSLVQQVKGVLGGTVSLPVYDEHCKKLYGEDGNWVEPLSEFPLICKRFASAARRIPHRKVATELLRLAEESVQSAPDEEGSGGAADGERGPLADISNENKIPLPKHTRDTRARVLRTAMLLVAPTGGEIFEVKCSPEIEIAAKAGQSRMDLPVKVKVSIRYVSKDTAEQFERLDDYTETAGEKKVETVLTKYIRRAKRRKRVFEVTRSGSGAVADEMQRTDGLGVRVSGADGELIYVIGTEDFFMRNAFKRRKICDSARKHRDGMISAARQHV